MVLCRKWQIHYLKQENTSQVLFYQINSEWLVLWRLDAAKLSLYIYGIFILLSWFQGTFPVILLAEDDRCQGEVWQYMDAQ